MTDEPQPPPQPGDEPDIDAEAGEFAAEAEPAEPVPAEASEGEEPAAADTEDAEPAAAPDVEPAAAANGVESAAAADVEDAQPAAAPEGDEDAPDDGSGPPPAPEKGPSRVALVAVALVALLAGAGTAFALSNRGGSCPAKGDAMKVEGTEVSDAEFARRLDLLRALYDVQPPKDEAKLAAFRGDAAKGMAVAILVAHDVEKRNLQAADKVVRDRLDGFIAQRYPQGGRDQFIQALGTYGVSEADVLEEFRRILDTQSLFKAVVADVKVGEDQISQAFEERKAKLAVPEKRQLRHLVVKTEDEAKRAVTRINGPETFEGVTRAVSLDASTKDKGGELGTVSRAQLDPTFGAAAFEAAEGAVFGPVQTKNGWHVGLVEDVIAGHPVTLEEVHDSLRDTLVAEASLTRWRGYLADRIRTADACYAKENRPADPKAPPPDLTTPTTG